jgi:hypothetical protein
MAGAAMPELMMTTMKCSLAAQAEQQEHPSDPEFGIPRHASD